VSIDAMVEGRCAEGTPPTPELPPRDPAGHKGTFGTVVIVGGSMQLPRVMLGGAVIAARAALRSGVGKVQLAVPEPLALAALGALESATAQALPVDARGDLDPAGCAAAIDDALDGAHALAIGPALGAGHAVEQVVARTIAHARVPLIVDADALNALARTPQFDREFESARAILTPHPGEYARLAAALHLSPASADDDPSREAAAMALAQRVGCVAVVKGARTAVSDGVHTWSARAGTPALGTGGSGDALAGIAASFAAQFHRPGIDLSLFDCARLAVVVHGLAARRWSSARGDAGLLASELCELLPETLGSLRAA